MFFGPSKEDIREAVEEVIRPKANIDNSFANLVGWTMDSDYKQYKLSTKCSKDMLEKPDFVNRNGNWTYLPNDIVDDNGLMQYLMENKK